MLELCNVGGRIVPLQEATIPVMDRGFLFGDSVYEVVRTHDGVPFAWPEHLARLRASAAGLRIDIGLDDREILRRMRATLDAARTNDDKQAYVRIVVTRGSGSMPSIDLAHAPGPALCVIVVRAAPPPPTRPARLAIVERLRVDRRALDPALKSGNYLNNVLALDEAKRRGADDCLMLNSTGHVTEASTSNVFAVLDGTVYTPPLSAGILPGVTRAHLLELCRSESIAVAEQDLTADDLRRADEVFLSSTLRDVWPVSMVDEHKIGRSAIGALTTRIATAFVDFCERLTDEIYEPRWQALTRDSA